MRSNSDAVFRCIDSTTGKSFSVDTKIFLNLHEFRAHIANKWHVPQQHLLLLYQFGVKVKDSNFRAGAEEANDIFVYDRRLFSIVNKPPYVHERDTNVDDNDLYDLNDAGDALNDSKRANDDEKSETKDGEDEEILTHAQELVNQLIEERNELGHGELLRPIPSPLDDMLENITYRRIVGLLTTNLGWLSALEIDVNFFKSVATMIQEELKNLGLCIVTCEQYLGLYCYDIEKLYNSNVLFLNQLHENSMSIKWKDCYNNVLQNLEGLQGPLSKYVNESDLQKKDSTLKSLDHRVNTKLKKVKKNIDKHANERNLMHNEIEQLREGSSSEMNVLKIDQEMISKFESLSKLVRDSSREILDLEEGVFTQEYVDEEIMPNLITMKERVRNLLTIAQALYELMQELKTAKFQFQKNMVRYMGRIAWIQLQCAHIKNYLLNDCNTDLTLYKTLEVEFARIEDAPLIYGLYLVEKLRRLVWNIEAYRTDINFFEDLKDQTASEYKNREKWLKNFGDLAAPFCDDLLGSSDIDELSRIMQNRSEIINNKKLKELKQEQSNLEAAIQKFIRKMKQMKLSVESIKILEQASIEASNISFLSRVSERYVSKNIPVDPGLIKRYKTRIRKLESLLHENGYTSINNWPSGVLNHSDKVSYFAKNTPSASKSLVMSGSSLFGNDNLSSINLSLEVTNLKNELDIVKDQLVKLEKDYKLKEDQLKITHTKIIDIGVENTAYRETLNHLNKELARLTLSEEKTLKDFETERNNIRSEYLKLSTRTEQILRDFNVLEEQLKSQKLENEKLRDNIRALETQSKESSENNEKVITDLSQKYEKQLGLKNNELDSLRQKVEEQRNMMKELQDNSKTDELKSSGTNDKQTNDLCNALQKELFEVFSSNIYILENIGLLLTDENTQRFDIKRVKGLKKGLSQSLLDESTQIPMVPDTINSNVYKEAKDLYEALVNEADNQDYWKLLDFMKKVYENKLYESAVINRFKDIETLAKRLTKENKSKRLLLDLYQSERICLRNFQVNDLALFLPTKETVVDMKSPSSSMVSSFSSVDLSTPPPFGTKTTNSPNQKKHFHKTNILHPWAAFTAFNETSRYFLKDDALITSTKEWFIGKITNIQKNEVENITVNNPFKLQKGTIWYLVTAELISME
ncbi:Autophagy-related protein 11 [Nakaseomyces bracarensis]|uniref:Autophagy-related protein 11 n=1 Tax=Nakaseomyces bracarensis TaxID=273131 RepID=A0ABR4P049_9SACH